jgi:hypothetical protein
MNKFSLIGASFLLAGVTSWAATTPTVWFQWSSGAGGNDHWYGVSPDRGTWADMNALTVGQSYDLVSLSSAGEEAFVSTLVTPYSVPSWTGSPVSFAWTGLNDLASEGTFTWTDGTSFGPLDYKNWDLFEPNNDFTFDGFVLNEDAVVINWTTSGGWNDLPAGVGHPQFQIPAIFESLENPTSVPESKDATVIGGATILVLGLWRARRARA